MAPWSDAVDEILGGDLAVALAHVTPAEGVVLTPITNFGLRDREAGAVTVLSSLGAWKKLDRMRRNPKVALAFHTRRHGYAERAEYVLVQGEASVPSEPDRAWLESIGPNWERFMGPRDLGPLWDRWMRVYHWERVGVRIAVRRVVVWPDLGCRGVPEVHGVPLPGAPPPQREPGGGTAPRVDHRRTASAAARLPDTLLGWVGGDGYPVVVPVEVAGAGEAGIDLLSPPGLVPPGGRRAGLTSHWFTERVLGQRQNLHTGWVTVEPGAARLCYAPHTQLRYRLPPSKPLYRLMVGAATRCGLRRAPAGHGPVRQRAWTTRRG